MNQNMKGVRFFTPVEVLNPNGWQSRLTDGGRVPRIFSIIDLKPVSSVGHDLFL